MSIRYVLAPEAAVDLVQIWGYIKQKVDVEMADRVEAVIREKILFLAKTPGAGHWRKDLTHEPVKFFSVYSYLIVYRPSCSAMFHGVRGYSVPNLFPDLFLDMRRLWMGKTATVLRRTVSFVRSPYRFQGNEET